MWNIISFNLFHRPETIRLTKDDASKNIDDSMDTMDMYQLFANQENKNVETLKSSESSKSPSPDARYACNLIFVNIILI